MEVVQCANCVHSAPCRSIYRRKNGKKGWGLYCGREYPKRHVWEDDYCSYGKEKESNKWQSEK